MSKSRYSSHELADLLNISERHVRRLASEGIIPDRGGTFDPIESTRAYLRYSAKDQDGRRARVELAHATTAIKRIEAAALAGTMVTSDELAKFVREVWAEHWTTHQICMADLYHQLHEVPEGRRRSVVGRADELLKAELIGLRERVEKRLAGMRVRISDPDRIERVLAELAGEKRIGGDD